MDYVWTMYGPCMDYEWSMYGICVDYVWTMYRLCMDYVWTMYGPSMRMHNDRTKITHLLCMYIYHISKYKRAG